VTSTPATRDDRHWGRQILLALGVTVVVVAAVLIASAAVPRWWAQEIGDRVDGSITRGVYVGLFYGFVFTFLALMVLIFVMRRGRTVRAVAIGLGAALLLATPNLLTLGIVLGVGSGAHAGDRVLDVEAPAFRGATLAGAIAAALLAGTIWYLLESRDSARAGRKRAEKRLEDSRQPDELEPPAADEPRRDP
jgi:hypothetical protein